VGQGGRALHLKVGICGEHGADPESVHFFHHVGLDYVSCSPFRIPVAGLEAGRVALDRTSRSDASAVLATVDEPGERRP
jgi:pyruvate,orthophosphate dikinase